MENEQELQQKYMQLQIISQQIQQLQKQIQTLKMQDIEIQYIIQSISGLDDCKVGSEVLAPVANGIFIKAKLEDKKTLLVNVGSDIVTEKTVPETVHMLSRQLEEVKKVTDELTAEVTVHRQNAKKLELELSGMLDHTH